MNPRCPTVTLTTAEGQTLRDMVRLRGARDSAQRVGLSDIRTFFKAACELPVSRMTAEVIRGRLDRI